MIQMQQVAPYPDALVSLVQRLVYRKGWRFWCRGIDRGQGSVGLTLVIQVTTDNSYPPHESITVNHYMPVPPAAYDERSWRWWLFQQILLVEQHEAMEFFTVDGEKPYAPAHGPGNDPYMILQQGTDLDRRTSFTGEINDE